MLVDDPAITTDGSSRAVPPSHRIPSEIIAKIISGVLPARIDYEPLIQKRVAALSTATSICRYWRYAALDHASLWSVIPIDRKSLGELYLQRSRNAPLFITFEAEDRCSPTVHQAMVSLLPHVQRVKKVQFRAPAPVLDEIFSALNRYGHGAQLEEINIQVDGFSGDERFRVILNLLLEHAPTTRVLRITGFKSRFSHGPRFPVQTLRQFFHLSHLELMCTNDIRNVSFLLTSIPTLTSIKIRATASGTHEDNRRPHDRIVPQTNLRNIHLQITGYPPTRVLDALKIRTGVHLECQIILPPRIGERTRFFPLPSEFFENASHVEELRITPHSCSGSGPNGSFSINDGSVGGFQPPIDDFSHLRKLVVGGTVEQRFLEDVVGLAPQLVSMGFVDCTVIKSLASIPPQKGLRSPVNVDTFVKVISEERCAGAGAGVGAGDGSSTVVNGTLEGERLEEFRSLFGSRN